MFIDALADVLNVDIEEYKHLSDSELLTLLEEKQAGEVLAVTQ